MRFQVTILGANSAIPTANRYPSSQLVNVNESFYLLDCGEGTQIQLRRYKLKFQRIEAIFISHLHGDHYFGLIGLLTTMHLYGREKPLKIYAHPQLWPILELQLDSKRKQLSYNLEFIDLPEDGLGIIYQDKKINVSIFPLNHKIKCVGFIIQENKRPLKIKKESIEKYNLEFEDIISIREGADFKTLSGEIISNKELTNPPLRKRKYVYCTDTLFDESISKHIKEADLLYHEATYLHQDLNKAESTFHSTAKQAGQMGKLSKAKRLILGHYSTRYKSIENHLKEAQEIFENVSLAREGDVFDIPF